MIKFTKNQQKSKSYDRNLSIEANAGSGKTAVLIERFISILLNEPDIKIKNLVGITFTEKAAKELKSRIYAKLCNIAKDETEIAEKAGFILERLSMLQISTIHSFCANILREYPNESGIDPNFSILEGIDISISLDQLIDETFRSVLDSKEENELKSSMATFIKIFGKKKTNTLVKELIYRREIFHVMDKQIYSTSDDEVIQEWIKKISSFTERIMHESGFIQILQDCNTLYLANRTLVQEYSISDSINKKCYCFDTLYNEIFTSDGKLRSAFLKKNKHDQSFMCQFDNVTEFINRIDGFRDYINYFKTPNQDTQQLSFQINLTRKLFILANKIIEIYGSHKQQKALLDFDDLLIKVSELLKIEKVKNELQERIRYIMVDEYQDTNQIQFNILKLLLDEFRKSNIFIVGDPKQSIYGFRNAEVEIFASTTELIKTINTEKAADSLTSDDLMTIDEAKGQIRLNESFRLLSDIIAFTNHFFRNLMSPNLIEKIQYSDLIKARNNDNPGSVEFLFVPLDTAVEGYEEELIARRILQMMQETEIIYPIGSEEPKRIQFGDIAILLRSRTNLNILEKTLIKFNIPFIISSGIGYFQTQEIYDLYNYLKFIQNDRDDLSLIGVLRSPFFSLSDSELFLISQISSSRMSFWEKLSLAVKNNESENIKRAHKYLNDDLIICPRLQISLMINRLITQTGWIGAISGLPEGDQILANVNKFLEIARNFSQKGFSTLYDFIERIRILIEEEEKEGQAVIDPTNEMVKIMTIHASKGLEFPVVFIPYLHKQFKRDVEPFFHKELGIGFSIPEINDYDANSSDSIFTKYLKTLSQINLKSEEKRILYVAVTRAHNKLFLSGKYNYSKTENSYLYWLRNCFNLDDILLRKTLDEKGNNKYELIANNIIIKEPLPYSISTENGFIPKINNEYNLVIPTKTDLEQVNIPEPDKTISDASILVPKLNTQKREGEINGVSFSATLLQTYITCPTRYHLKYSLGATDDLLSNDSLHISKRKNILKKNEPQQVMWKEFEIIDKTENNYERYDYSQSDPEISIENDNPYIISGPVKGKIIHKVFEEISTINSKPEFLDKIINNALLPYFFDPESVDKSFIQKIKNIILNFLSSASWNLIREYDLFYTEYELNIRFGINYLTGTIDRLVINNDKKECYIIDYKTEKIINSPEDSSLHYKYQMLFYSYLVKKMHPDYSIKPFIIFLEMPDHPILIPVDIVELKDFEIDTNIKIGEINMIETGKSRPGKNEAFCIYCEYAKNKKCILN